MNHRTRSVVFGLLMLSCSLVSAQDTGVTSALQALAFNFGSHPASQAEDIYKGLYQAIFGPGHAIPDPEAAEQYLMEEVSGLGPQMVGERPCLAMGGEPKIVRVNLRPFVARGHDLAALLAAFVASADEVHGTPAEMEQALEITETWLQSIGEVDKADGLGRLRTKMAKTGFPAIHHSQSYQMTYFPAYRVVTALHAEEHGWCN